MVKIDIKDRKILMQLDMDARMPLTELAKKIRLSRQVVEYRLKRMQKEKIIHGAITVFDSVVLGFNWYRIILRLLNISKEEKMEFIEYLRNHPYIFWLGEVGGNWDLVINFICKDNFQFNEIFEELKVKFKDYVKDYEILIYIYVHDLDRRYLLANTNERVIFYHKMKFNPGLKIDNLDKDIIRNICNDAMIPNIDLGKKLKVTGNTIRNRIDSMIKKGVILGFRLFINPAALGYKSTMLFFQLNRADADKERTLYSYLKSIPNITFIVKHLGRWSIGIEVETKDELEFQEIFIGIRGKFSDIITDFETFPLFKDHIINYFPKGNLIVESRL